jgi:hypothetical protein
MEKVGCPQKRVPNQIRLAVLSGLGDIRVQFYAGNYKI